MNNYILIKIILNLGMVFDVYNPCNSRGQGRRIASSRPAQAKSVERQKKTKAKR
jgi:hypothetical protein